MRTLVSGLIALLCAALVATASASAANRKAKPTCAKKGSKTVLRAPGVRLFTAPTTSEGQKVQGLYGCLSDTGRKQLLAVNFDDEYVSSTGFDDVRLAGRYVAWHASTVDLSCKADCPPGFDPIRNSVEVHDLRRRRAVRSVSTGYSGGLALTQRAAVAWLSDATPGPQQVNVADRDGRRVLDTGAIAATSLRAEISIVSWVRDGVERFARLR